MGENMKGDVQAEINHLLSDVLSMDPEDMLTEEEINGHLESAFKKFDEDNSSQLGKWEFQQAWFFLGLKGTEAEIADAYKEVDTDNSGLISLDEFKKAIKGSRLAEMILKTVLGKMGVQIESKESMYEAFKATEKRRRMMKREYENRVAEMTKKIIEKLSGMSKAELPKKDPQDERTYKTLVDTFNAFDKD